MNTQTMSEIKTTMLHSTILAVKLNRTRFSKWINVLNPMKWFGFRLVVLLETRAIVYGLETLQKLKIIETPSNPKVDFVIHEQSGLDFRVSVQCLQKTVLVIWLCRPLPIPVRFACLIY